MSTILEKIVETKRQEVNQRRQSVPLEVLKERISELGRPRNFFHAVTKKPTAKALNLIAEIKKASPSAGIIREDFDPVKIAQIYAANGADALSVLTDEQYFQGKLEYIHAVRDVVKLPVLRKDFVIDPYQVYETRAAGAGLAKTKSDARRLIAGGGLYLNNRPVSDVNLLLKPVDLVAGTAIVLRSGKKNYRLIRTG